MKDIVIRGASAVLEEGIRRVDIAIDGERIAQIRIRGRSRSRSERSTRPTWSRCPGSSTCTRTREPGFAHRRTLAPHGPAVPAGGVTVRCDAERQPATDDAENLDGMIEIYRSAQ